MEQLNLRNLNVLKECWKCGKKFYPVKGYEETSHFCCCECSNDYYDLEVKEGVFKCRYCGKKFREKSNTIYRLGTLLCSAECKNAIKNANYKKHVAQMHKNMKEGIVNEVGRRCKKS